MKESKILRCLDRFKGAFIKMGVDYEAMRRILALKLLMDSRTTSAMFKNANSEGKTRKFRAEYVFNLFMSFMLATFMFIDELPILYKMVLIFATTMMFTLMYMLSDFTAVILDVRDRNLIGITMVSPKTLNMARMIHVSIYLAKLLISLIIFPVAAVLIKYGPVLFLVFIIEVILMIFLVMFFTTFIYYLMISCFKGERLKDIINYIQMVFVIIMVIAQQALPRGFDLIDKEIIVRYHHWYYLCPPFWMSAPFELFTKDGSRGGYIGLSICSVIIPCLLMILYVKWIAPYFEVKLSRLNAGGEISNKKNRQNHRLMACMSHAVCKGNSERAYFNFIEEMTRSERKFKLQLYPQVAICVLLPIILVLGAVNFNFDYKVIHEGIVEGGLYYFIYLDALLGIETLLIITRSECFKASWFYALLPIASPEPLYKAMVKVVLIKYVLPIIVVHELILLPITGLQALPVFIVILLNSLLMCLLSFKLLAKKLPFTEPFKANDQSAAGTTMGIMILIAIIGFVHYGCRNIPYSHFIIGAISLILSIILWQVSFPKSWEAAASSN